MEKLTKFEYWVQRTLPQVYDDSLSFQELLYKVISYLNSVIDSQNATVEEVEKLLAWFNSLDVQDEINLKLDAMVTDGTLDTIINQNIFNDLNTEMSTKATKIELNENKKFTMGGSGILTENFDVEDVEVFKEMMIDYVLYWYHPMMNLATVQQNIQDLNDAGINVVFSLAVVEDSDLSNTINTFSAYSNVVAWVLMDEPDGRGISIATQESKINLARQFTKLPLAVTCYADNYPIRLVSKEFDYYYIDSYIKNDIKTAIDNGTHATFKNYYDFFVQPHHSIGGLIGLERCIPMVQAFREDAQNMTLYNDGTMIRLWEEYTSIFPNNNVCFFLYDAPTTNPTGFQDKVKNNVGLQNTIKKFTKNLKNGLHHKNRLLTKTTELLNGNSDQMLIQMLNLYSPMSTNVIVKPHFDVNVLDYSGFEFDVEGVAILDLGELTKDVYFKARFHQIANADTVSFTLHKLKGSDGTLGPTLDTVNVSGTVQYSKILHDFNSRYLAIKTNNTDVAKYGYITMTQPSVLGLRY